MNLGEIFSVVFQRKAAIAWLEEHVSEHRLTHIFGVEQMAQHLARLHGLDPEKAAIAGLLHDLAKFFPPQKLLTYATAGNVLIDEICQGIPHLLHADVSALVAQAEFGIEDPVILQAIANHTLGQPQMDDLSCIIFLADSLEPGRGNSKTLKKLRKLSDQNLKKAVWKVCDYTLKYLMKQQKTIHPRIIATRNWAIAATHADNKPNP